MANHGNRIRRYMDEVGVEEVEEFIDACLSIEDLIDIHSPFIRRRDETSRYDFDGEQRAGRRRRPAAVPSQGLHGLVHQPARQAGGRGQRAGRQASRRPSRFPSSPSATCCCSCSSMPRSSPGRRDVLSIIRDEAYYFAPQGQTKIMNEGWASYWHSTIMTRQGARRRPTSSTTADHHSRHAGQLADAAQSLQARHRAVPRHRGPLEHAAQFGKEYDDCDDYGTQPRLGHATPAWAARRSSRSAASTTT